MDTTTFNQQIETLNKEVIRYQLVINQLKAILRDVRRGYTCNLSSYEIDRRLSSAQQSLKVVNGQIKRVESKYYSQFPLTQDQYCFVGFPSGVTNIDGSDRF